MNTLSPIVRFDPRATRDYSPLKIGPYTVRRTPLRGTHYTVYSTMLENLVAGRQVSYPSVADCAAHVHAAENRAGKGRASAALLDTELHGRMVELLRVKEQDTVQLSRTFGLTSTVLSPVLSMLVAENRIVRIGTTRRRIYAAS